jgi:transcriptional regulator with XRE-family HTH domain
MGRPASKQLFDFKLSPPQVAKHPDINNRFREVRIERDLTQEEFAEMLGENYGTIRALESGRQNPTTDQIRKLHKRFNKSYDWIIDGIERIKR